MFYFWRRIGEEDRLQVWRLYGRFCVLMLCGSCFGVVTWTIWTQGEVAHFSSVSSNSSSISGLVEASRYNAQNQRYTSVYIVTHGIEFFFLSIAQLMVLDRMLDFAFPPGHVLNKGARLGKWIVLAAVVTGNAVALCSTVPSSLRHTQAAEIFDAASVARSKSDAETLILEARVKNQSADAIVSIQFICEVVLVFIILLAFAVVGAACASRVAAHIADAGQSVSVAARQLHVQIVGTSVLVFLAFLFRSVHHTMFAVAAMQQESGKPCSTPNSPTFYCSDCFNTYTHMWELFLNLPELLMAVYLVSSPLALLVSLWGMTSHKMMQFVNALKGETREMNSIM
jgi:hypothetical protein